MENLPPLPALNGPLPYQVYCCVWYPNLQRWKWHRLSSVSSLDAAQKLIEEDARNFLAMRPKPRNEQPETQIYTRVYRIFESTAGFTVVGEDQIHTP